MWFTAIAQLVGQQAATPHLDTTNPYLAQESSTSTTLMVVGGLAVLAGVAYFALRSPPRRLGRSRR